MNKKTFIEYLMNHFCSKKVIKTKTSLTTLF